MEDRTITITTETGEEIICDILFTHHSDDFNKDYVVFVKRGTDEASASEYVPNEDGTGRLVPVETDEEWTLLEDLLEDYVKNSEIDDNSCQGGCASCGGSCGGSCECDGDCDCDK